MRIIHVCLSLASPPPPGSEAYVLHTFLPTHISKLFGFFFLISKHENKDEIKEKVFEIETFVRYLQTEHGPEDREVIETDNQHSKKRNLLQQKMQAMKDENEQLKREHYYKDRVRDELVREIRSLRVKLLAMKKDKVEQLGRERLREEKALNILNRQITRRMEELKSEFDCKVSELERKLSETNTLLATWMCQTRIALPPRDTRNTQYADVLL